MKNKIYTGFWSLPNQKLKISGKLTIDYDKRKTLLTLFTKLNLDGNTIAPYDLETNLQKYFILILGETRGNLFTLFKCKFNNMLNISDDMAELSYKIEFLFFNIHITNIEDFIISKAELKYPYLSTFYDGCDSIEKLNEDEVSESRTSKKVLINENLNLNFIDKKSKKHIHFGESFKMEFEKRLSFDYTEGKSFLDAMLDFYRFGKLMEFSTKERICFAIEFIMIDKEKIKKYDDLYVDNNSMVMSRVCNFSLNISCDVDKKELHQNFMLFSRWGLQENQLNDIIVKWFENIKLQPIYDFYIDSNNWFKGRNIILSNVMYNNKFLNLMQGLDSYYDTLDIEYIKSNEEFVKKRQQIANKLDDVSLKLWMEKHLKFPKTIDFIRKLENLVATFDIVFRIRFRESNFLETYCLKAKDYRHKLSHGDVEKTYQGEEFDKIYYFSQILLCACILQTLNLSNVEIREIVNSNFNLNKNINHINS